MPRSNPFQPSFNAGEITPRLAARTDFSKYSSGLETAVNVIPLAEGGLMRRAASRYIAATQSSSVKARLKRFEFSTTQAYILELGEQIMRFYRHQGQIIAANITASITNGTFPSGIASWSDVSGGGGGIAHDVTNLRLSLDPGGTAASDIASAEQQVTNASALDHTIKFRVYGAPGNTVDLQIGTATGGTQILSPVQFQVGFHCKTFTATAANFFVQFRSLGTYQNKIVGIDDVSLIDNSGIEIDTPWTESELFTVNGPQSADVLYLYHPDNPTYKLLRLGHTSWSLVEVPWVDGPYLDENISATTLLPSAATGLGINLTLSVKTGVNDDRGWLSTDIGRLVRYQKAGAGAWGYTVIVSITSPTVAVADVREDFQATPTAAISFRLGAWSGTTGYPSIGTFYEQRQFAANTSTRPQSLWATQTADFENHTPDNLSGTVEDDDALDYTISADEVNAIRWFSPGEDTLVLGTTGGEWIPESAGIVITPSDIVVRRRTKHGSANIQPVRVGNVVLFVQAAKRKIREFGFAFEVDGFQAFDMTRLAQHITRGGIVEMDFQQEPDSLVWAVRSDGQLLSMTFRREEDVVGWARHIVGGSFSTGDVVVESVAVIPGADGAGQTQSSANRDEVWITVKRTINSATVRYVEVLERDYETGDDENDSYYSDSIITYDGVATSSITGLDHLEGETVKVFADGFIHPDQTISSGAITLDADAAVVQIGLGYTHTIKPLKFEGGTVAGTAVGKTKQIFGVTYVLLNSHTITFGPDTDNLRTIDFRVVSDAMDTAVPFFTGERFEAFDGDWKFDPRIVIQSDDPVPFTLLALAPEIEIRELK